MSSYHSSFRYLNKKSDDLGLVIVHFNPDVGETDSYLSQEQVYTDSVKGTKRILYGTRYNSVAIVQITVMKKDKSDFSLEECRGAYRWLTGNQNASWLDLYVADKIKYSMLCTVQDVKPQKLDARTVALNIYFESVSPWAYSPECEYGFLLGPDDYGPVSLELNNQTDDLYTSVYLNVQVENDTGDNISIKNETLGEETIITGLNKHETVTISSEQFIVSDVPNKIFGNKFNFVWPRLAPGTNSFLIKGNIKSFLAKYRHPIKIGDCAIDVDDLNGGC